MDVSKLRREYTHQGLTRDSLNADPIKQFELWFDEARQAPIKDPTAMSLATAKSNGEVGVRTVLLKVYDPQGFVFFTNYSSNKSQHIAENPNVALLRGLNWIARSRSPVLPAVSRPRNP